MKILVIKENHGQHGVNISADRLTKFFKEIGHTVDEFTVLNKPKQGERDERDLTQWDDKSVNEQLVPRFMSIPLASYDLILANDIMSTVVTNKALHRYVPNLTMKNSIEVINFMHNEPHKILRLYGKLSVALRQALNQANVNITLSQDTRRVFEDIFPSAKFEVFDNIVDVEPNWKDALTRIKDRNIQRDFNEHPIRLVMISSGARVREKGIDDVPTLARALDRTINDNQEAQKYIIDVIGFDLEEVPHMIETQKSLKHVEIIGHGRLPNDEAMEVVKKADILLSLSLFETLLVTAIEAAQMGVIILGYNTNDINRDEFGVDVPYGDVVGLANKIQEYTLPKNKSHLISQMAMQLKYVEQFKPMSAGNKFLGIAEKYKKIGEK